MESIIENEIAAADSLDDVKVVIGPVDGVSFTDENTGENLTDENLTSKAFNILFNLLLISFLLGFIFNLPFKRYFSKKRKGKNISPRLYKFCKRFLIKSPLINAGILGISYLVSHIFIAYMIYSGNYEISDIEKSRSVNFFYISLIAALLALLFVYFWEKHRVHIKYIHHIYNEEELRKRIFNLKVGRIRNRMITSAVMTTLLPLTIVILYLFLSVTYLSDLNIAEYSEEQKRILFGDLEIVEDLVVDENGIINVSEQHVLHKCYKQF